MRFAFNDEQQSYRDEVTAFLREQLGDDVLWQASENEDEAWEHSLLFCKALSSRGWVGQWWPEEYGGSNRDYLYQLILLEELAYWGAPRGPLYIGWDRVAWTILLLGTEEQKKRYLAGIKNVEDIWCQGFSEPGAGSDLASLSTRAVASGDSYVINGQKTWNSYGHRATHTLMLARTDPSVPKHKGISMFVVEMATPGVTVQRIPDLRNDAHFNNLFFDDARVPATNMLGEPDRGWYAATSLLDAERAGSGILRLGTCRRALAMVRRLWDTLPAQKQSNSVLRHQVAEMAIQVEVLRWLAYRVAWMQQHGQLPNMESSMSRCFGSELEQKIYQTGYSLLPQIGQLTASSKHAFLNGSLAFNYLGSFSTTIAGGTAEVVRNIIATRGVGLPR